MIHYRRILELHHDNISLRGIAASTGNFRPKVTEVIEKANVKGLECPLEDEMTDKWIEEFLFPVMRMAVLPMNTSAKISAVRGRNL